VHPEIQAETAGYRAESLDLGQSAIIGAEEWAIAIQSALRGRQGLSAEGASGPRA